MFQALHIVPTRSQTEHRTPTFIIYGRCIKTGGTSLFTSMKTSLGRDGLHRMADMIRRFVIAGAASHKGLFIIQEKGLGGTGGSQHMDDLAFVQGGQVLWGFHRTPGGPSSRHASVPDPSTLPISPANEGARTGPEAPRLARSRRGAVFSRQLALMFVLALLACAHAPADPQARAEYQQNNDPAEPTFATGGAAAIVGPASVGLGVVDQRADLLGATDSLEHNSLDYYAALRSVMAQRRDALVAEGKADEVSAHKDVISSSAGSTEAASAFAAQ
jgi:hypothetical protein